MADTPVPRSKSQILGDMLDAFKADLQLKKVSAGSPSLSVFEAAAQSDLRTSQDIFNFLASKSLDSTTGAALLAIAADEGLQIISEKPASGFVTVTDASFAKISSKISQAAAAPIVGSVSIAVADAGLFPSTGSIYIGRGTSNYEGPLAYTSITPPGGPNGFYVINLSGATVRFHNKGDGVVLAQGGNRLISAGTVIQTPQGNVSTAVQYTVLYGATIPDGEVSVDNITVISQQPGLIGNIPAGTISGFSSPPFAGATVTNPLPFTNGLPQETEDQLKERIRAVRQSKQLGTALAIKTFITGITSQEENKTVTSASVVSRQGFPTTLYIDDGTGYEEVSSGIAIESLATQALGGEQFFQVSADLAVTKSFVESSNTAPFALVDGAKLAVKIGGVQTEHTFDSGTFRSIDNATSYEIVASINADPTLLFSARVGQSASTVIIFAKADTNEDVEIAPVIDGIDANGSGTLTGLGLPSGRVYTMLLYQNDVLLFKDGQVASLTSQSFAGWQALSGSQTLALAVDGTPAVTYTFVDQDFVNAATGYSTISNNSLAAWAAVINAKIPGITAVVTSGTIVLTSNVGASDRASIVISGGSLVTNKVFTIQSATGAARDYTLNRNNGKIRLEVPLSVGDRLSCGTKNTRAFYQSKALTTVNPGATANLWASIDGGASIVLTGVTASTPLDVTPTSTAWGFRILISSTTASSLFTNLKVGDWAIIWDPALPSGVRGTWRISKVSATGFEIEKLTTVSGSAILPTANGLTFVRTAGLLKQLTVPVTGSLYTASSIASTLASELVGGSATTYQTSKVRIATNTLDNTGDIALVAADTNGQLLGFTLGNAVANLSGHLASVISGNSQIGTPDFRTSFITTSGSTTTPTIHSDGTYLPDLRRLFVGGRSISDSLSVARYGANKGFFSTLTTTTPGGGLDALTLRTAPQAGWIPNDRAFFSAPYGIGPSDSLVLIADEDEGKRFTTNLWRTLTPVGTTYGIQNTFKDADASNVSLAVSFGLNFSFNDFVAYMAARAKTHSSDSTKTILWRYGSLGPDGNQAQLRYILPSGPNQVIGVTTNALLDKFTNISISLASGALKTISDLRTSTKIGTVYTGTSSGLTTVLLMVGLLVHQASRTSNVCTFTFTLPTGVTNHGFQVGDTLYLNNVVGGSGFTSGAFTVASVTSTTVTTNSFPGLDISTQTDIGSVSNDSALATFTTVSPALVSGDLVRIKTPTSVPAAYLGQTMRVASFGDQYVKGVLENFSAPGGSSTGVVQWNSLGTLASFQLFPIGNNTSATMVSAVTALHAVANSDVPVVPTLIGTGLGIIDRSSAEENSTSPFWYSLTDGVNYISSTIAPGSLAGDYQLRFKNPVSSGLTTSSDWANEVVRIVPVLVSSMVDWFNAPAVSGLFSACSVQSAHAAKSLQISSLTPGSAGSVQVQGGTANSATANVVGAGQLVTDPDTSTYSVCTFPTGSLGGLFSGGWVAINNTNTLPKSIMQTTTALTSIAVDGTFTFNSGGAALFINTTTPVRNVVLSVESQGGFKAYVVTAFGNTIDLTTVSEGDWVHIGIPAVPTGGRDSISSANASTFLRVVRVVANPPDSTPGVFWVENPSGLDEQLVDCDLQFMAFDSTLPGDVLTISTPLWNVANMGSWNIQTVGSSVATSSIGNVTRSGSTVTVTTVAAHGFATGDRVTMTPGESNFASGVKTVTFIGSTSFSYTEAGSATSSIFIQTFTGFPFQNRFVFKVDTSTNTPTAVGSPPGALGATNFRLVQVTESIPGRLIKQILAISPNQTSGTFSDIKFTTSNGYNLVSATAGSIISALDKLNFPLTIGKGVDGYRHSTGLIAEATKVLYGDPGDPITYPGVAAEGALINTSGPLVRRIQVGLLVRLLSGSNSTNIASQIRSAVASLINSTPVGTPIALSDIVKAAGAVSGVVSVTITFPAYNSSNDLISIQPFERPLVLSLENDITVTFTGE